MGLDMYLYGVKSQFDQHDYNIGHVMTATEIGYWRKANQIHRWFVDNVQDGRDECKIHELGKEKLEELLSICKQIKENPEQASKLLPTQQGFFFGSYEYDEFYMMDIEETIMICEWALSQDYDWFMYQSSW